MIIPAFICFARTIHITGYVYYGTPFLKVCIVDYYVQHNIRKQSRMNLYPGRGVPHSQYAVVITVLNVIYGTITFTTGYVFVTCYVQCYMPTFFFYFFVYNLCLECMSWKGVVVCTVYVTSIVIRGNDLTFPLIYITHGCVMYTVPYIRRDMSCTCNTAKNTRVCIHVRIPYRISPVNFKRVVYDCYVFIQVSLSCAMYYQIQLLQERCGTLQSAEGSHAPGACMRGST